MPKKLNYQDFRTRVERSKNFSLFFYGFSVAQTLIFHTIETITQIFDISADMRVVSLFNAVKISLSIENAKTLTRVITTISGGSTLISYIVRYLFRITNLYYQGINRIITITRLRERIVGYTQNLPKFVIDFGAVVAVIFTLAEYDPDTLGTLDVQTLGDLDYQVS